MFLWCNKMKLQGGNKWIQQLVEETTKIIKDKEGIEVNELISTMSLKYNISLRVARKYLEIMEFNKIIKMEGQRNFYLLKDKRKVFLNE